MKKILLSLLLIGSLGLITQLNAQCTVSNATILNVQRTSNEIGSCTLKFDLSFTMQNNNGNKTIVIHLWPGASYPNPPLCYLGGGCGQPTAAELSGSYGSLVINNETVTYYSAYPFRSGVTILAADPTITRTGGGDNSTPFQFSLTGITIPNQPCSGGIVIRADLWSTNAGSLNQNTNPQCATQNVYLGLGDPVIAGFLVCGNPRMIDFLVTTESSTALNATYQVRRDDGDGIFNSGSDVDVTLAGSTAFTVSNSDPFGDENSEANNGVIGFTNNGTSPFSNADYWLVVNYTTPDGSTGVVARLMQNECIPLPVQFKSFNANRTSASNVAITWTTASEQNSKGFNVQKNVGGVWKTIAFVPSQAQRGNSSSDLSYSYKDPNNEKGITQYRIQQVDLDGNAKYSDIRAIRGEGTLGKVVVYPNPSVDGKLNVVFEDNSAIRDVQVNDMQGRVVKSYKGITNNILVIERLTSGFYTIKITNRNTAATSVEKVVVK